MNRKSNTRIAKLLAAIVCIALMIGLAVVVSADAEPTVIYLDGTNGSDSNDGSSVSSAVKTLTEAYKKLTSVTNGVATNASAKGIIVLCGPTPHWRKLG